MVQCTTWGVEDKRAAGVFFLVSEVSKFEFNLQVIHGEKAVNGLTAANIIVDDSRYEPVILFGQANGVRDPERFGLGSTSSVFNMFGMGGKR